VFFVDDVMGWGIDFKLFISVHSSEVHHSLNFSSQSAFCNTDFDVDIIAPLLMTDLCERHGGVVVPTRLARYRTWAGQFCLRHNSV
jgi:hypothetical protein